MEAKLRAIPIVWISAKPRHSLTGAGSAEMTRSTSNGELKLKHFYNQVSFKSIFPAAANGCRFKFLAKEDTTGLTSK
jgi:hypothetical protein